MKHTLAGFFAFLLAIFLSLFIVSAEIRTLARPDFLLKTLSNAKIYDKVPDLIGQLQISENADLNSVAFIKTLSASVSPETIRETTESFVYSITDYISSEKVSNPSIDLTRFKNNFTTNWLTLAPQIYKDVYENLPDCAESKTADINTETILSCKPENMTGAQIEEIVKQTNPSTVINNIPDRIDLNTFYNNNSNTFSIVRKALNINDTIFWLSIILSLITVIVLCILVYPEWKDTLRWIGWPMVIVAGPVFILSLFNQQTFSIIKSFWINENTTMDQFAQPILASINQSISIATIKFSLFILAIGVIFLITSIFIPKNRKNIAPGFDNN